MQDIPTNERLENIEFEVPIHPANSHCSVVAHNLNTEHNDRLALSGINLSGHDARPRLIFRKEQLPKPTPRPTPQKSDIVGNLHNTHCNGVEGAMELDE